MTPDNEERRPMAEAPSGEAVRAVEAQDHSTPVDGVVADAWAGRVLARSIGVHHVSEGLVLVVADVLGGAA